MFWRNNLVLGLLFIFLSTSLFSQAILEKKISIPNKEYEYGELFSTIEEKSGARFSYNSDIINEKEKLTYKADNKKVEECLDDILKDKYKYQSSGKYIVILAQPEKQKETKQKIIVKGKITSENDMPIANVSIYDIETEYSTLTNEEGEFEIEIPKDFDGGFSIGKLGYIDTVVLYETKVSNEVSITLNEKDAEYLKHLQENQPNNFDESKFIDYIIPKKIIINSENLRHLEGTRDFQISLVPGVSSNLSKFGVLKNKVSLNVLIGYSRGVEGVELAGLMNIDKEDVEYLQLAGLTNLVGGNVKGFQAGGIANNVWGDVNAWQLGGIWNAVRGDFEGGQVGGVLNINAGKFKGAQIGGVGNFNLKKFDGLQIAGTLNVAGDSVSGSQIGGVVNLCARTVDGLQIAGVTNGTLKKMNGVQIAGVLNTTLSDMNGGQISGVANISKSSNFQISGLLNATMHNKGVQIAPFNVCDTSSGISIGFLSFVRKGYNNITFNANEIFSLNLSAHLGTEKFYNIFTVGYQPEEELIWGYGYGFGHKFRFNDWAAFDIELIGKNLNFGEMYNEDWFPYYSLNLYFDFKIKKLFSIYLGPSVSLYSWNKSKNQEALDYLYTTPSYQFYYNKSSQNITKAWVGFYFGIGL